MAFGSAIDKAEAMVATATDAAVTGAPVSALHGLAQTFTPPPPIFALDKPGVAS